jgi:hypothetical protein
MHGVAAARYESEAEIRRTVGAEFRHLLRPHGVDIVQRGGHRVELGKRADLIVLDRDRLEMAPAHDPAANILHSASPRSVGDALARRSGSRRRDGRGGLVAAAAPHGV